MGSRPRKHQLEDESEVFFRSLLPSSWVFRRESHDYGIDGVVEIFNEQGVPLGFRAYVQLKGTDSKIEKTQRSARFKSTTWAYWRSQDIPTLIVRYASENKRIYYAWCFDRRISFSKDGNLAHINFSDEDLWCLETPDEILNRLARLRQIYSQVFSLPISMSFVDRRGTHSRDPRDDLREPMEKYSRIVKFEDRRQEAEGVKLHVLKDELLIDLEGLSTVPIGLDFSNLKKVAADLVVGAAICYGSVGQIHIALKLIKAAHSDAEYHAGFAGARILSQIIIKEADFELLFDLVRNLWDRNLSYFGADFYLFGPMSDLDRLSEEEANRYVDLLFECANQSIRLKESRAGRICYNIGESLTKLQRFRLAIRYFRFACALDEKYRYRDYIFIQASVALYRSGRYRAAALGYLKAIRLSNHSKPEIKALLGDSQLMRGRFGSAVYWIGKALSDGRLVDDPRLSNFTAVFNVASWLVVKFGFRVVRGTSKSNQLLREDREKHGRHSEEGLQQAIEMDPMNVYAWNELGVHYTEIGRHQDAVEPFYFSAVLSNGNLCYWFNLIMLAFSLSLPEDFCTMALAAASVYGHDNLSAEANRRAKISEGAERETLLRIGELLAELPLVERPMTMRIVKDE